MQKYKLTQFLHDLKQKTEKENQTQSESSDNQNQNSLQLQKQNQAQFSSIKQLSTYFEFIRQTKQSDYSILIHQVNNSPTEFVQNLQIKTSQSQNLKENAGPMFLYQSQYKTLSDLLNKFKTDIENQVLSKGRFEKLSNFTKQLVIHDVLPSKSHQILKLQVQMMWYKTEICILNELGNNPFYQFSQVGGSGSFGMVYFTELFSDFLAIKCIPLEKLQDNHSKNKEFDLQKISKNFLILKKALIELFFVLLFSDLQIGPKAKTIGGFDMVIYQDSITFATEICSQSKINEEASDLKTSLFYMHVMQIAHRDIKPANIMFSETYKKNVFIDFGCTQALDVMIGKKSLTHFIGTPTFCSEEALILWANEKKSVDLYFNDMFGLKKCITELIPSQILVEEPDQNISQIYEVEMISIKHCLYVQDYEKFIYQWKLFQKKHFQNLEGMQKRLLCFFKDLKPNEFLRKFYWEEINSDIKEQPEFKDLEVALKNEHSKLLFYLDIERSKIDAFEMRKILFKKLKIEFSDLTPKQKEIELCLIHKVTMKKRISVLLTKINNQEFQLNEIWENIREDFEKLCVIVCGYSSILQSSQGISNEQKLKMCVQVLKIVEKIQDPSFNNVQIVFKCPIQCFEPMNQFYQYFLFKIFPRISQKWRQKTMIQSLSNLCLLGYPLNNSFYVTYLLHHLVFLGFSVENLQEMSDDERIQRVNNFWECKNCLLLLDNMQYTKSSNHKLLQITKQKQQKLKLDIQKLMSPSKAVKSQFFDFNFQFFNSIVVCLDRFNQQNFMSLIEILQSPELQKMSSSNKLITKWKKAQTFNVSYFSTVFRLKTKHMVIKLLQRQKIFEFQRNKEILPFLIFFYLSQFLGAKPFFQHLFKKIDEIINCNELSFRFELQRRCQVEIGRVDFKKKKQNVKFIANVYSGVLTINQTVRMMRSIFAILYNFLNHYERNLTNLSEQLVNLLDMCYPMIERGAKMVLSYIGSEKHNKFKLSSILQTGVVKTTLEQVENKVRERQLVKQLIYKLILIYEVYKKIGNFINNNEYLTSRNNQTEGIKILAPNYCSKKGMMPENQNLILSHLIKGLKLFQGHGYWSQVLFNSQYLRQQMRKNRNFAVKFVNLLKQGWRTKQQVYMHHQFVQELFDQIHLEKFDKWGDASNIPTFEIMYEYILIQLVKTNYDLHWCTQMVKFFETCWEKEYMIDFISQNKSLRYIFNCFVYLNSSFKQIKSCFSKVCLFLKQSPEDKYIQNINQVLFDMFWCNCENCFSHKPQNWNSYDFSKHLSQTINEEKEIENPYMSMVYYYVMKKKTLEADVIRRFVVSILKSMSHVVNLVRDIIMEGLLFPVIYSMQGSKIQQNDFIQTVSSNLLQKQLLFKQNDSNIHLIEKSFKNFVIQLSKSNRKSCLVNEMNFKKITKKQSKKSSNQKLLYYYGKIIKNNSYKNQSLGSILEKGFFKEEFIENYHYPPFFKQAYLRKMRRYHELKQNYKQPGSFLQFSKYY